VTTYSLAKTKCFHEKHMWLSNHHVTTHELITYHNDNSTRPIWLGPCLFDCLLGGVSHLIRCSNCHLVQKFTLIKITNKKIMCLSCLRLLVKVNIPFNWCEHFSQVELSKNSWFFIWFFLLNYFNLHNPT
jgi:hypothetical protein